MVPVMATNIPKKIGRYDVLDVIGKGGMGIVYRAKDPLLDRMIAIKIMTISTAEYPDLLQRFFREAKATAILQHANIVTVYELGEHEGSPYLAMEYLEGASLESLLRTGKDLTLMQKIDIIVQTCQGLSYAHQRGIVHRDIKPGNIMVLKEGSVKIVDFGIARIGDTTFTRTGQVMGSLNYMSVEQLNDKLQVDQRTDVYSTGVVLYQMLTGALPFDGENMGAVLMKILNDAPPPFSKYISSYPPEIESITMKALAKDREQRYASADELALDLVQLRDRLKDEFIGIHMQRAESLLHEDHLSEANNELLEVLKLDRHHTRAASILRGLRKRIEKEQSAERARQLREQAREAIVREDYDPALNLLDQAISLDTTDGDLRSLRIKVQAAKAEFDHIEQLMQQAEDARRAGNLDAAKQAIEEVLPLRPDDPRVKSLYRFIQKELEELSRQRQLDRLLEAARKEMENQRFTAAFDILKEAEEVAPDAPALRLLQQALFAAREQESERQKEQKQRKEIRVGRAISEAQGYVQKGDYAEALNVLERAQEQTDSPEIKDFLRTVRNQSQAFAQARSETLSHARRLLQAGQPESALAVLQAAPGSYSKLEEFQELFAECNKSVDRAASIRSTVTRVEQCIEQQGLDEAETLIKVALQSHPGESALSDLLQRVAEERARVRRLRQSKLLDAARSAMSRMDLKESVNLLTSTSWDPASPLAKEAATLLERARIAEEEVARGCADIQEAIDREEFDRSLTIAAEVRNKFGNDPQVLRLEAMAKRLLAAQQKSRYVEKQREDARVFVQDGRFDEAIELLTHALQIEPEDATLEVYLRSVQEARATADRERRAEEARIHASDLLHQKNYAAAIETIQGALATADHSLELQQLLDFARKQEAEQRRRQQRVAEVVRRAEAFLAEDNYQTAIQLLESEKPLDAPQIENLLARARQRRDEREAADEALRQSQELQEEVSLAAPPRKVRRIPAAIGIGTVISLLVIVVLAVHHGSKPAPLQPGFVELNPLPWAEVVAIKKQADNQIVSGSSGQTPMRVSLAPGDYLIELKGPNGIQEITVKVETGKVVRRADVLPGFDADKVVDELLKEE